MKLSASAAAAVLLPLVLAPLAVSAYSDTAPMLAYTSRSSSAARRPDVLAALKRSIDQGDAMRGPAIYSRDAARLLASDKKALCDDVDAIALVEIDDLTSHSLASLPATAGIKQRILSADSQIALVHVSERTGHAAQELQRAVQQACAGRKGWSSERSLMTGIGASDASQALLASRSLQDDAADGAAAQKRMFKFSSSFRQLEDGTLDSFLGDFQGTFKRNLVIVTRSAPQMSDRAPRRDSKKDVVATGLLHYYQFWSSGLLLSALIVGLLFLPICYVAVGMIGGISTPDKLGEKSRLTEMSKKAT